MRQVRMYGPGLDVSPDSGVQCSQAASETAQYEAGSSRAPRGNGTVSGAKAAMAKTIGRHIRIDEGDWRRIEALAEARGTSPNRLLVELAVEALDRREWPRNELELQLLRSAMFAAQALARDMIADGRDEEVEQIRRSISEIVPDLTEDSARVEPPRPDPTSGSDGAT